MRRALVLWIAPVAVLALASVAVWTAYAGGMPREDRAQLAREMALYRGVRRCILDHYAGSVQPEEMMVGALRGLTVPLDDYSDFLGPEAYREFQKSTEGIIHGGIGIRIVRRDGRIVVVTPLWGTPACRAGILPDDEILAVDGHAVAGFDTSEVISLLAGKAGEEVQLQLRRASREEPVEVTVVREEIELPSVEQLALLDPETGVGYVRLSGFQDDSADEVKDAINTLAEQGADRFILDLRGNPGGRLRAAIDTADLFLNEGVIVITEGRNPVTRNVSRARSATTLPDYPLVVLVNGESASASEVVAGALQDQQRALVVGTRTWGKGSVQEIFTLDDGRMALKLTVKRYLTPSGRSLHREPGARDWGVRPDLVVRLDGDELTELESSWRDAEIISDPTGPRPQVPPLLDRQLEIAVKVLQGLEAYGDQATGR